MLTSTRTAPAVATLALHSSADALKCAPTTDVASKWHSAAPSADADADSPLPSTVSAVPPDDTPMAGHTDDTVADARYVKRTPHDEYCCPFDDTSSRRAPTPDDGADAHSSCVALTRRAHAVEPLDSKRQRSAASVANAAPDTATRVPPASGPAAGRSALTRNAACA